MASALRDAGPATAGPSTCAAGDLRKRQEAIVGAVEGFARDAGTVGGLHGPVRVVTDRRDYDAGSRAIPGSLRHAVDLARQDRSPAWIRFDPAVFAPGSPPITLLRTLHLPPNVTIEGSCADVRFEGPSSVDFLMIRSRNIIVAYLDFRKNDYPGAMPSPDSRSCIRLNNTFDGVAILHNDLSACGDGTIDITVNERGTIPPAARVTVAFNRFLNHDKVMLFGTPPCPGQRGRNCGTEEREALRAAPAALRMTLFGNLFLRTSQRHPTAFHSAYVHAANNVFAFTHAPRPDGGRGAAFGALVIGGARGLFEENLLIALGAPPRDSEGFIGFGMGRTTAEGGPGRLRLGANRTLPDGPPPREHRPDEVPGPGYGRPLPILPLAALPPERVIGCVAARAGRHGADRWPGACGQPS